MYMYRTLVPLLASVLLSAALPLCATSADAQIVEPLSSGQHSAQDSARAAHLLNRLTFGARPGDLSRILAMGADKWLAAQLNPDSIDDAESHGRVAAVNSRTASNGQLFYNRSFDASGTAPLAAPPTAMRPTSGIGQSYSIDMTYTTSQIRNDPAGGQTAIIMRRTSQPDSTIVLYIANPEGGTGEPSVRRVVRAESSEKQLLEVISDFWLNHFSVFSGKMLSPATLSAFERDAVQKYALGKFRDLVGAVAHSPAMLFYLDNQLSGADSTRLNVPEFRTFSERGLTPAPASRPGLNENFARELLELHTLGVDGGYTQDDVVNVARAFTGWRIDGRTAPPKFMFDENAHDAEEKTVLGVKLEAGRGAEDGEKVLDILARHPATATFIARKLVVRLVSDEPPEALVRAAAATFTRTDGDITEVIRTIVTSDEFLSASAFRSKVKSPYEYLLSIRRALDLPTGAWPSTAAQLTQMQQPVFGRETPDGYPETADGWLSSGSMFNRLALAMQVGNGDMWFLSPDSSAVWSAVAEAPFDVQYGAVMEAVFAGRASQATKTALAAVRPAPGAPEIVGDGRKRLAILLGVAFGSPEFQHR